MLATKLSESAEILAVLVTELLPELAGMLALILAFDPMSICITVFAELDSVVKPETSGSS